MSHAVALVVLPATRKGKIEDLIAYQMKPFDENEECFAHGSRWDYWGEGGRYTKYYGFGTRVLVRDLDLEKERQYQEKQLRDWWGEAQMNRMNGWGMMPEELKDVNVLLANRLSGTMGAPWAFVHNRRWNECDRMGWFGETTPTECELKTSKKPRRCLTKTGHGGVIVSWNEDTKTWGEKFHGRFIKPLQPTDMLVVVDYHV